LPPVSVDAIQIQQVLLNLLMNAIEAVNDQSTARRMIDVGTQCSANGDVEISVKDRGAGIPDDQIAQVFKPFFTTKERGLGLGLSICQSIMKSHGGTLSLRNNDGSGTTATITLPRQDILANVS
jgi:signal transduction histidine kinase